jgi:DNA-binding NarL/FixJ family response regulator
MSATAHQLRIRKSGFLSEREVEILRLIGDGLATKEIGAVLRLSPKTIEFHKTRLYKKIGVYNAVGATRYAMRAGYID